MTIIVAPPTRVGRQRLLDGTWLNESLSRISATQPTHECALEPQGGLCDSLVSKEARRPSSRAGRMITCRVVGNCAGSTKMG